MKILHVLSIMSLVMTAAAQEKPYNESADAKADIQQALIQSEKAKTPVLVVFGANWCGDCKMLDKTMKQGTTAPLVAKDFIVVKVDVARFNKNVDVANSYGVSLSNGIPAVVILSPRNKVLYATKEGELSNARKMGEDGVYKFFKQVTESSLAGK